MNNMEKRESECKGACEALLFICLGNICRSPAAEGVLKTMLEARGMSSQVRVDSAGIGSWHVGELPDARMRRHAQQRGYVLDSRARQFTEADFNRFDYIVVMDEENEREILSRASSEKERGQVLRMCDFFVENKGRTSVPDPYYGDGTAFELALDLIEDGCRGLMASLFVGGRK